MSWQKLPRTCEQTFNPTRQDRTMANYGTKITAAIALDEIADQLRTRRHALISGLDTISDEASDLIDNDLLPHSPHLLKALSFIEIAAIELNQAAQTIRTMK